MCTEGSFLWETKDFPIIIDTHPHRLLKGRRFKYHSKFVEDCDAVA